MTMKSDDDDFLDEYELAPLLEKATRGKHARGGGKLIQATVLDSDVAEAFQTAESVNAALRLVMQAGELMRAERAGK